MGIQCRPTTRTPLKSRQEKLHEAVISLSLGKVESNLRLGPNIHGAVDGNEILNVERIALEDEGVKAEIAKLQLPEGAVVISDPWPYGMLGRKQLCSLLISHRL
jgi:primary-amine oxidase